MPYLNLDPNYPDHPKTLRLIGILGENADIYPVRLWAYCTRIHPTDGALKGYSVAEIEAVIRWRGPISKAVNALVSVGFLKRGVKGYFCTDWHQHEGHLKAFSRRGKLAAKARWNKYASSIAKPMQEQCPSRTIPAVPTIPNITTAPAAADFSNYRLNIGKYKNCYVANIPADECQFLLKNAPRLGQRERAALQWRIDLKNQERGNGGGKETKSAGEIIAGMRK